MDAKVIKEMLIYLPSKVIEGILGVLLVSLYTKTLTTSDYGSYTLAVTTVLTLFLPLFGWIMHASSRYTLKYISEDREKYFNSTVWTLIIITNIVIAILFVILSKFLPTYTKFLKYVYKILIFYSANQILSQQMAVRKRIFHVVLLTTINSALKLIYAIILFNYIDKLDAVIYAYVFSEMTVFIITFITSGILKNMGKAQIDNEMVKEFIKYGMPLIGLAMTSAVTNFSDRYIIKAYFGKSYVAIYQGNYSISSAAFTMLMVGIMRAVNPNILKAWEKREEKIQERVWQGLRLFLLIAVPSVIGLSVLSPKISKIILDEEYVQGSNVMMWVAIGMLVLGISEYINKPLELHKKTRTIFLSSFAAAICNIILNFIFVPKFGYISAAITTFISYIIYILILIKRVKKDFEIKIDLKSIVSIFISATIMGIFTFLFREKIDSLKSILIIVMFSMLIYGISIIITGEGKEEIKYLENKFKGDKI